MKNRFTPILFLLLLLASCFKYIKVDNSIKYTVDGFHDVTIDQNDSGLLNINIELLSGDPTNEYTTFKITGIPDSVAVNYDSLTFRPNYWFPLVFYAHAPRPGVYPITATTTSPTMGTKVYTFNLIVTSLFDCTRQFTRSQATYIDNHHEAQMSDHYGSRTLAYVKRTGCDSIHIQVVIDSMEPGSEPDGVRYVIAEYSAFVNCTANTLLIFPQNAQWIQPAGEMVKGGGTFVPLTDSTATITIADTVFSGSQVYGTRTLIIH
jgi:hypothetical protein